MLTRTLGQIADLGTSGQTLEILANLQNLVDSVVDPVRPNKVKLYHKRLLVAAAHLKYDNCVDFSNVSY